MTQKIFSKLKERRKMLLISISIVLLVAMAAGILLNNTKKTKCVAQIDDPQYEIEQAKNDLASKEARSANKIVFDNFKNKNTSGKACKNLKRGVDISVYQGDIDWKKAKAAGVEFAFIRVGYRGKSAQGVLGEDKNYRKNLQGAIDAHIPVGVYIYSQAITQPEAVDEAEYVLKRIANYHISLPIVIDYEYAANNTGRLYEAKLSKEQATDICNAFCDKVESLGYTGMVYANASMLRDQLNADKIAQKHRIWLANYVDKTAYKGEYDYWQCSSTGDAKSFGMSSTYVDLDFWFDDGLKSRRDYSLVFDSQFYANKYADLREAFGYDYIALYRHFLDYGMAEGRQGNMIFDPKFYREKYFDLLSTYGKDYKKYYEHFIDFGMAEGRQGSAEFNVNSYKNANLDLRNAFGKDLEKYYRHFLSEGCHEAGRKNTLTGYENQIVGFVTNYNGVDYSKVYDFNYYKEHNLVVKEKYNLDDIGALEYFVTNGIKNAEQANEIFDVVSYKNRWKDLRNAYKDDWSQYYIHYIYCGSNENREATGFRDKVVDATASYKGTDYSKVYDFNYYVNNNPDIKAAFNLDENKTIEHFVNCGMNEGRQAKENFSVKSYKNRYADLRNAFGNNLKEYYLHYMRCGAAENRIATGCDDMLMDYVTVLNGKDYKDVYDYNFYIKHNLDVAKAFENKSDKEVLEHFVNCGMNEGRQAKETFSVKSYKNRYVDLRRAFRNDYVKYFKHYMESGKTENRLTTGFDNKVIEPVTELDGVDYSKVYNYEYYINNNPDVKNAFGFDDIATLEHFVNNGMNEGRRASENFDVKAYKDANPDLYVKCGDVLKNYYMEYLKN
ncbi:glycoside hydrolase family 25 protein [Lachnobacterium bovis]|uniref:glycoside hydrolase family 25 protein n=1 Tax=Lachnobacterium bovis TaxID=140626 RepID=UPI000690DA4A|nr:glycoside hydrolase family 25 protein [Lachnobacterium bovis]